LRSTIERRKPPAGPWCGSARMIFHKFCPLCGVSRLPWRTMEDHGAMVPSWHHGFPMVFIGWLYGDYRVNPGPMVIAADTKAIAHSKELRDEARTGCQFLSAAPTVARCSLGETTSQPPPYCHTNPHNAYLSHCKNMGIYISIVTMASTIWIMFGWFPSASFFQRHDFRCPTQMSTCNSSLHWRSNLSSIWPAIKATVTMFYVWLSYLSCPGQTWSDLQSPIFISENRHV
jgi:hypothetical protein